MQIRSLGYDSEADELDLLIDTSAPVPAESVPVGEGIYIRREPASKRIVGAFIRGYSHLPKRLRAGVQVSDEEAERQGLRKVFQEVLAWVRKEIDMEQLLLGALLHDVGKFIIRARQSGEGKDHSELGEEWLSQYEDKLPPGIPHFARLHHVRYFPEIRESNLTLLVYHADNLSAAGDRVDKEGVFDHRGTPLASIFSRISLSEKGPGQQSFFPLKPLGPEMLFPLPRDQVDMGDEAYDRLLQPFTRDFEKWLDMGRPLGCLPLLLEKYWSTIPSETKRVWIDERTYPDISLYDHTKTTAAFALALYQYFRETGSGALERSILPDLDRTWLDQGKKYFRIVGGDFSGVQRFIYTISSRGALKGLRGRSFFLELLTEHVADELLAGLGLFRTNLIFAGGGHLYILCQNTPQAEQVIVGVQEKINSWLRAQFHLRLYLALGSVEAAARDLDTKNVSQTWQKVGEKLGQQKGQRFRFELKELMAPEEPLLEGCTVCHRDDLNENEIGPLREDDLTSPLACWFCRKLYEFGDDLARDETYLVAERVPGNPPQNALALPSRDNTFLAYHFVPRPPPSLERGFVLNQWDLDAYLRPALVPLFYAGHVSEVKDLPKEVMQRELEENPGAKETSTASLVGLARAATGIDRVAALRMDVDHTGRILVRGFHPPSFSRLASFSRQLNLFFKFHLNAICRGHLWSGGKPLNVSGKPWGEKGRYLGVIYSGGDDLFVIGAWDDVIEFALDVEQAFQLFTGNPEITLSGGLVIQDPHFPLYHMAAEAGQAEDQAKDQGRGRLTLAFFPERSVESAERRPQQTYTWQEIETKVLPLLQSFLALGEYDREAKRFSLKLPRALIYRLFSLIEEWKEEGKLYLPRMAYILSRLQEAVKKSEMQVGWPGIERVLMNPENMAQLKTALTWLELLCRSGQEGRERS